MSLFDPAPFTARALPAPQAPPVGPDRSRSFVSPAVQMRLPGMQSGGPTELTGTMLQKLHPMQFSGVTAPPMPSMSPADARAHLTQIQGAM